MNCKILFLQRTCTLFRNYRLPMLIGKIRRTRIFQRVSKMSLVFVLVDTTIKVVSLCDMYHRYAQERRVKAKVESLTAV